MASAEFPVVALVGAGTIGRSWAVVFARAGIATRVFDSESSVRASLRAGLEELLARGEQAGSLSPEECATIRSAVRTCESLEEAVEGVRYVQESVPEDLEAKRSVFAALDALTPPDAILGSSASTFPMTQIAATTRRPERCVVVHPTNPPHLVPLVEIAAGERTDPEVVDAAHAFMEALGQSPIRVRKERFGFVLNRLQFALAREAFWLAKEGVASIADIDRCLTDGLGLRWAFLGPFGVEATNAASVEDDLTKFGNGIRALFADVCRPYDGPGEDEIASVSKGVAEMFAGAAHSDVVAYRDEMVAALRRLKEQRQFPVSSARSGGRA
ncbi:MAG: 3-hydroxyacyl-CoA dehydrogenase NAD-binding domain-containing protein [Gaiellaceae bacterium]